MKRGKGEGLTANVAIKLAFPNPLIENKCEAEARGETRAKLEEAILKKEGELFGTKVADKVTNFGLLYDKLIPLVKIDGGQWLAPAEKDKAKLLEVLRCLAKECLTEEMQGMLRERIKEEKEDLQKQGFEYLIDKEFKTESRLVIGLGSESVLETSLTLHKVWGIPYIPSTALKGVTRMVAFWEVFGKKKGDEEAKLGELWEIWDMQAIEDFLKEHEGKMDEELFQLILRCKKLFGAPDYKGLLLFLDAYPQGLKFEVDVMTVHYTEYYKGDRKKACDDEQPNPIHFLTVGKGVGFKVVVLWDGERGRKEGLDGEQVKEDVERWLRSALNEFGIGAKTRVGYGILRQEDLSSNGGNGENAGVRRQK